MLKKLAKGSVIAGVGVVGGSIIEYAYYIMMAKMLGPTPFGLLSTSLSIMFIMLTLITSGVGLSLAKFISEKEGQHKIKALIYNGLAVSFIATCVISAALFLTAKTILPKTGAGDLSTPLVLFSAVMPFLALSSVSITALQGLNRMPSYSATIILNALAKLAAALYAVGLGYGLYGAIGAYAAGALVSAAYGFYLLRKHLSLRQHLDTKLIKRIILFSLPIAVLTIFVHALLKSDVVFLKFLGISNEEIGYYTAPALIARAVYFAASSIAVAALPILSAEGKLKWGRIRKPLALILLAFAGGNTIILVLHNQIIRLFFTSEYWVVSALLPPLSFAASLLALAYLASTALIAQGKPQKMLAPLFFGFIVYAVMMTLLTPKIGLHATYASMMAGNGTYLTLTLAENRRHATS